MNVGRGLLEKDLLVFSFMFCAKILKLNEAISSFEWIIFFRGSPGIGKKRAPRLAELAGSLSENAWINACDLATSGLEAFKGLTDTLQKQSMHMSNGELVMSVVTAQTGGGGDPFAYQSNLKEFYRFIHVKNFAEDKVVQEVTKLRGSELVQSVRRESLHRSEHAVQVLVESRSSPY